jgi:hypothetical protein
MQEIKIVTAKNAVLLEKELAKFFASGFGLVGQLVYTPEDGLVQIIARKIEVPESETPENKEMDIVD